MLPHRVYPLAATAALLACLPSVEQSPQPDEILVARFDSTTGVIPVPNDLALQAAATLPAGVTKATLEGVINLGGFPAAAITPPGGAVLIPVRALAKDPATGLYTAAGTAPDFDATALNAPGEIAFVRYDVTPPVNVPFQAQFLATAPTTPPGPAIVVATQAAALTAGARYVVAVRSGLKTKDGRSLAADQAITLIAPNKDLGTTPENRPPGLSNDLAQQLDALRLTFANPLPWTRIGTPPFPAAPIPSPPTPSAAQVCQQALKNPAATAPCWLPCVPALVQALTAAGAGALCAPLPAAVDPFAAIDTVFPHEEIASIQTFKVAP